MRILPCVKRMELLCVTLEETRHGEIARPRFQWAPSIATGLGAFPWVLNVFSLLAQVKTAYLAYVQYSSALIAISLSILAFRISGKKNALIGLIAAALWLIASAVAHVLPILRGSTL